MSREMLVTRSTAVDEIFSDYSMYRETEWLAITGSIRKYSKIVDYNFEMLEPVLKSYYEINGVVFELDDFYHNSLGETVLYLVHTETGEVKKFLVDEHKHFYVEVVTIEELYIQNPIVELE